MQNSDLVKEIFLLLGEINSKIDDMMTKVDAVAMTDRFHAMHRSLAESSADLIKTRLSMEESMVMLRDCCLTIAGMNQGLIRLTVLSHRPYPTRAYTQIRPIVLNGRVFHASEDRE